MSTVDDQTLVVMAWEDGRLDGVEVACTITSMAAVIAAEAFTRRVLAGKPIRGRHIEAAAAAFVDHVRQWTLRNDRGLPVPVRLRDFMALNKNTVFELVKQWVKYVNDPPATQSSPAPEVEATEPAADVEVDPGMFLEARSLQDPGPDEVLVEPQEIPDLVDA